MVLKNVLIAIKIVLIVLHKTTTPFCVSELQKVEQWVTCCSLQNDPVPSYLWYI